MTPGGWVIPRDFGSPFAGPRSSHGSSTIAIGLHEALLGEPTYLGLLAVDLSNPVHLGLYRLLLGLYLRVKGDACHVFWRAFEPDGRDGAAFEELGLLGFATVEWEDIGARDTIFDEFDTPDHFSRLQHLRQLLTTVLPGGSDDADDLLVVLEDLNPRLAATLGTAAGSFLRAISEEDLAQAGLSGRRYCEQLADAIYPARSEPVNGRDVGQGMTKNRLWAYVQEAFGGPTADRTRIMALGGEIDRVWEEANGQLHGPATRTRVQQLVADLAVLTAGLLSLDTGRHRQPYLAYSKRTRELLHERLDTPAG